MVSHFMRNDVGARKISGRAKFGGQLPVKRQVDVNLLVARTIERSGRSAGQTAGRGYPAAEQHELGGNVGLSQVAEVGAPHVLSLAEYRSDKIDLRIIGRCSVRLLRGGSAHGLGVAAIQKTEEGRRTHSHEISDDHDDDGADADPCASPAQAGAALIFDIFAAAAVVQFHGAPQALRSALKTVRSV